MQPHSSAHPPTRVEREGERRVLAGWRRRAHRAPYCSSLTCSIHSTIFPSSASWMARCVIAVVGDAPCQCFSPGENQTTSPGRISSTGPPSRCARPKPALTTSVCPSGCVCQAVRAPGSKVTAAPATRAGAGAVKSGSMRTVPRWNQAVSRPLIHLTLHALLPASRS